ncbi:WecB/TagA/CpsF family glycosyltransferase [Candidatus Azambacteria bacterium]|nr:WecB/TagA/CpsF family glycosyltransferase [Candidatus Azambacteria bacterium]
MNSIIIGQFLVKWNGMERYIICGVRIDNVTMDEALSRAEKMILTGGAHAVFSANPEIVLTALRDTRFKELLNTGDLVLPDGIGVVRVGRILGMPFRERVAGVDFMEALCARAAAHGWPVFFLGGRNSVAERTSAYMQRAFPALRIAGWSEDMRAEAIGDSIHRAEIIFVALGAPKQEAWIRDAMQKLRSVKCMVAVGGAFDMIAGDIPRAPAVARAWGLEWLWRLCMEPVRRWRRIMSAVIVFPIYAIACHMKRKEIIQ